MMPKSSLLSWSLPFSPYFVDCMMMAALPKKGEKSGGFACRPRFAWKVCMPKSRLLYGNSEGLSFISLPTQNMKKENNEDENVVLLRIDGGGVGQPS